MIVKAVLFLAVSFFAGMGIGFFLFDILLCFSRQEPDPDAFLSSFVIRPTFETPIIPIISLIVILVLYIWMLTHISKKMRNTVLLVICLIVTVISFLKSIWLVYWFLGLFQWFLG